ncbi:MAG: hypothetical protein WBM09_11005 [Gallionella sp.]
MSKRSLELLDRNGLAAQIPLESAAAAQIEKLESCLGFNISSDQLQTQRFGLLNSCYISPDQSAESGRK